MYDFFAYLGISIFLYYLIYFVLICITDCDLSLAYAEKFGVSLESLKNKVVWVTGASSGIGKHLAIQLAALGAKVVITARRVTLLNDLKTECLANGASAENICILPFDLLDLKIHQQKFDEVIQHFGQLDILVNNAGRSQRASWENIDLAVDKQIFDLNVFSVISLSRIAVKYFLNRGEGHLAVTSSCAGFLGVPFSGSYTASKHAIHGYFNSLRAEKLATNLDVTIFCPGPTFTEFLQESFTEKEGEKYGIPVEATDKRMTSERCAQLFNIALANKLDLTWAALFPISPLVYLTLYFPNLHIRIMKQLGAKRMHKLREGKQAEKTA